MKDCVFCNIINGDIPCKKVYEDEFLLALLDINPFMPGHTLIIPKEHTLDYDTIDEDILVKIVKLAKKLSPNIVDAMNADGYTLVQNNGNVQEVKHFHLHIIPKYNNKPDISVDEAYKKITECK
ncbi:MAG: HIT domain-containing protein [Bacilli bacterium]|nr:HIT domain-containing protein [Bacilli bacterium]